MSNQAHFKKTMGALHIWAMGVGLVISGDYFGWNYGLLYATPIVMLLCVTVVGLFYLSFIFCYTELVAMIPNSGGPLSFVSAAFGHNWGVIAGAVTLVEFVFAPPAIGLAIGSYLHYMFNYLNEIYVTIVFFILFGWLNCVGVAFAATLELVVTLIASLVLLVFFTVTVPHTDSLNIFNSSGLSGFDFVHQAYSSLPFAIWFFLGIEGVAMCVEEVKNPEIAIPRGLIAAIITLIFFALMVIYCATGILPVADLVQNNDILPKVLAAISSKDSWLTRMMIYLSIFGLLASFNGIIFGASRQIFALSRARLLPKKLSYVVPKYFTPVGSIIMCCVIGIICALSNQTAILVNISALGAVFVYTLSLAAFIKLKFTHKKDQHTFKAPLFPVLPVITLILSLLICGLMIVSNLKTSLIFSIIILFVYLLGIIMRKINKGAN